MVLTLAVLANRVASPAGAGVRLLIGTEPGIGGAAALHDGLSQR
ncbi:hypothetical protein [Salinisphaera sp.]|nr:hypothetical protein [Salinisphaera sp.]HET7314533.1 hypothetical protein [Salinisphaera sp.]